jgi:hypothetical protein
MNEQNLIPIPAMTVEQQREFHIKGGKTTSPLRKLAAKLRELKKKGLTNENAQRLYELMTDSDMTDLDILVLLETMRSQAKSLIEKERAARLYIEWRKLRHGDKIQIETTNKNLNLDVAFSLTPDEIARITKPKTDTGRPVD